MKTRAAHLVSKWSKNRQSRSCDRKRRISRGYSACEIVHRLRRLTRRSINHR